jgi:hypothetical protein
VISLFACAPGDQLTPPRRIGKELYATVVVDGRAFEVRNNQHGRYELTASGDGQELADIPGKGPLLRVRFWSRWGNAWRIRPSGGTADNRTEQ